MKSGLFPVTKLLVYRGILPSPCLLWQEIAARKLHLWPVLFVENGMYRTGLLSKQATTMMIITNYKSLKVRHYSIVSRGSGIPILNLQFTTVTGREPHLTNDRKTSTPPTSPFSGSAEAPHTAVALAAVWLSDSGSGMDSPSRLRKPWRLDDLFGVKHDGLRILWLKEP